MREQVRVPTALGSAHQPGALDDTRDLETVLTIQTDGWVASLYRQDRWCAGQRYLDQEAGEPLSSVLLNDPEPQQVGESVLPVHQGVADDYVLVLGNPAVSEYQLSLDGSFVPTVVWEHVGFELGDSVGVSLYGRS